MYLIQVTYITTFTRVKATERLRVIDISSATGDDTGRYYTYYDTLFLEKQISDNMKKHDAGHL